MKERYKYFFYLGGLIFYLQGDASINAVSVQAQQQIQNYIAENPILTDETQQAENTAVQYIKMLKETPSETILQLINSIQPKEVSLPCVFPVRSKLLNLGIVKTRKIKTLFLCQYSLLVTTCVKK